MLQWKLQGSLWTEVQIFEFFEFPAKRGLRVGVALALILFGLFGFAWQLDDVAALEQAKRAPVLVDAVIMVETDGHGGYIEYVSYTYDGVDYDRVYYMSTENHYAKQDDGDTIQVALNPRNHGQLVRHIVNELTLTLPLIALTLGFGLLLYCACLQNPEIHKLLVRIASMDQPDYVVDVLFMATLILMLMGVILWMMFPLAVGCGYAAGALLVLSFGVVFRYSIYRYGWRHK